MRRPGHLPLSDFQNIHNHIMAALDETPEDFDSMLCTIVQRDKLSLNQSSHRVIVIEPDHRIGLEVEWDIDFRTVWVATAVALKFKKHEEKAYTHRKIVAGVNVQPLKEMTFHSNPPRFVFQSAGSLQWSFPPLDLRPPTSLSSMRSSLHIMTTQSLGISGSYK
ncbi:hypothetical protein F5148DRAFT_178099 [Russula earlei]|uniref:Uncharacterized protein n=1 Tax=Russula earlei TaxID=71964 RepID=A0ACC0UJH8_9AGAM|nr:hypothetical protein F5148DRAFT_178099 [Russula earlei]